MLLTLMIILSAFPATVFAADYITNVNSNATFGVISGSRDRYGHEMHYANYDGNTYLVFCVQYGKTSPDGSTYEYGKDFKKYVNREGDTYEKIADYIAFGYTLQHGDGLPNTKQEWIDACCTQQFVWETLGVNPTRSSWDSTYMSDSLYKKWKDDTEDLIDLYYNKQISFNGDTKKINLGGSATLTDSNGVLKYYPSFSKTVDKVTISHTKGENKLNISVADNCTTHSVKFKSSSYDIFQGLPTGQQYDDSTMNYVYFDFESGSVQNLMFSKYVDPYSFSININVEFGNCEILKTSEDGKVDNIKFNFNGNGIDKDVVTDIKGRIFIGNIPVGVYTVTEYPIDKYVAPKSQTVTISNGQTSTVNFSNVLKKFRVTVVKSDIEKGHAQGDAKLSGAKYGIFKGEQLIDTYTTDDNASFTTKYYVCDTDWTIREIESSEGYLVNDEIYKVGAEPKLYTVELNNINLDVVEMPIKNRISLIKHSDDGSSKIETPEKDAEFEVFLKSSGGYNNADEDERDVIITDKYGFGFTKLLPYGTYTVHQIKGTEGTEFIADFDVFIDSEKKEYKYLINDPYFYSFLKVVKTDTETGKQIAYAGAGFELYAPNGEKVEMTYTYPTPTTIDTFYTNSEGYLVTPEKLIYGEGYKLVEVQAPYGYVLDSTPIEFDITQEHSTKENALTIVKVERPNIAQKGVIEITKEGEIFSSVCMLGGGYIDENGNEVTFPITYSPIYENGNLANAVFQIYAAEDITTLDGTVRYQQGELVDEITTSDNGIAKSKLLYLGKYTVIEKTAPDRFINANEQYDIELTYAGQNVSVTSTALSVYNERQKVFVSLLKELSQDEKFKLGMNNEILSVQFGIFADENITAADGTVIPKDALITYGNCDENGKLTFNCDLPIGYKFYAKEMATDEHYILSNAHYTFDTEYQGQEVKMIEIDLNSGQKIENKLIYSTIKGLKIDRETEKTIKGALFGLFNEDETEYTKENAILTAESDENGIFTFENIPFGNWIVKELQPAENYLPSDDIHHITVSENEQIIEITAVNDRISELKTTATVDGEKEVTAKGEITIEDVVEYKHLIPGKEYKIIGTLMDKSTGKPFEVDGKPVTSEAVFIPEKPSGKVTVSFTFDSSAIKEDTKLVVFETLYRDNVEIAVHADIDDEGQTVKINVPVIKTPKTGDNSNRRTIATVMSLSALGIVSLAYYLIKKKKSNKGGKAE